MWDDIRTRPSSATFLMKQSMMTEVSTITSACSEIMTFAAGDMKIVFEQTVGVTSVA